MLGQQSTLALCSMYLVGLCCTVDKTTEPRDSCQRCQHWSAKLAVNYVTIISVGVWKLNTTTTVCNGQPGECMSQPLTWLKKYKVVDGK